MAQHGLVPFQRPVLPGDGHPLDRAAVLVQALPETPVQGCPGAQALVGRGSRIDVDNNTSVGLDGGSSKSGEEEILIVGPW